MKSLKDQIIKTGKGGTIDIPYGGEFIEELVINKSITIRSNFSVAAIVGKSPTMTINKSDVTLENLHIECSDAAGTCLSIKKGVSVNFNNVFVKGRVEGIEGENGEWDFPAILELPIEPNKKNIFKIIIHSPVDAKIYPSDLSCVKCTPPKLLPGLNEINIYIDELFENTIVSGDFIIETDKHKLKRKISLNGNTFQTQQPKSANVGEYLWVCKSSKVDIDESVINKLPEGNHGEEYEMILDQTRLKLDEYVLRIDGLPNGLSFINNSLPYKIGGIPRECGKFEVIFIFSKNNKKYKYSSTLKIIENIIVPLKIKPIPDLIEAVEDDLIHIVFNILSSNSLNISYKTEKDLPKDLQLYESTGEIRGKIANHGIYDTVVKISDGKNELHQKIKFYIRPKNPLGLSIKRMYQFYNNENFEIPLNISDEERLKPSIDLKDNYFDTLKIETREGNSFVTGTFVQANEYPLEIRIEDIYGRKLNQIVLIKCVEKLPHPSDISPTSQPTETASIKSPSSIKHNDGPLLSSLFNQTTEPYLTDEPSIENQKGNIPKTDSRSIKKVTIVSSIFSSQNNHGNFETEKTSDKDAQPNKPLLNSKQLQQPSDSNEINHISETNNEYKYELSGSDNQQQNDGNSKKKRVSSTNLSPLFKNNS